MLRICFVKQGTAYGPEYVNILADMISRNLEAGFPGTFECFTDDPSGISDHINCRPIPSHFTGWWAKLWLFKDGHFSDEDRILYFDLDTVVMGPLDGLVRYDGAFATLRDFFKPYDDVQSAVMAWPANIHAKILTDWENLGCPKLIGGDQEMIQRSLEVSGIKPEFFQDIYPGLFVSYKSGSFKRVPPRGCSVVCFHGQPKPHNCNSSWVNGVWQINGTQAFEIEQFCNTEDCQIEDNIKHAMSLPYPWLEPRPIRRGTAVIVGGSPSLNDTTDCINQSIDDVVFATNKTASYMADRGIGFDYHVLVDAREENLKFLTPEGPAVDYLLASQCNKNIFDAVAGKSVTVWHPKIKGIVELTEGDNRPRCIVGGGSTVCLKAIAIAYIMGFRKFRLIGMDSSYADGKHHAYAQSLNDDDLIVNVQVDDRTFVTTPWMVAQADEFEDLLFELLRLGCDFEVYGDGLIPYIARESMKSSLVSPVAQRGQAILDALPNGPVTGAEIGVFAGELSAYLLTHRPDLTLYLVDSWKGDGTDYIGDSGDFHASLTQDRQDIYHQMALEAVRFAGDRAKILPYSSKEASTLVTDGSLDFVFIDADHSYEGCKADISLWLPKLKDGGVLSGHDYENTDYPKFGVRAAVDEFAQANGCKVTLGENFTWFIHKVGILSIAA